MKYAVEMDSSAIIYILIKAGSDIQQVTGGGGYSGTQE
jgi:hypothetical protein